MMFLNKSGFIMEHRKNNCEIQERVRRKVLG